MIVSEREKGLLVVTVIVLMYGALFMIYGKQREKINAAIGQRRQRETQLEMERDLVSQRAVWEEAYGDNASLMPVFESTRQVETHWLNLVERLAKGSGLTIIRRQVGEERQEGEVFEIPIECREWEGTLESVVKFLHAVHSEGAMLDVRKLTIRPAAGKGTLRGSLTVYCAYLRSDSAEPDPSEIGAREIGDKR